MKSLNIEENLNLIKKNIYIKIMPSKIVRFQKLMWHNSERLRSTKRKKKHWFYIFVKARYKDLIYIYINIDNITSQT